MSSRKYWTVPELVQDARYWEKEHDRCKDRLIRSSHPDIHDYWLNKQNAAQARAKASRDELRKRGHEFL